MYQDLIEIGNPSSGNDPRLDFREVDVRRDLIFISCSQVLLTTI